MDTFFPNGHPVTISSFRISRLLAMMSAYESRPSADPDAVTAAAKAAKTTPAAAADLLTLSENELLNGNGEGDEHVFLSDGEGDDDEDYDDDVFDDDDDAEGGASFPLLSQKRGACLLNTAEWNVLILKN